MIKLTELELDQLKAMRIQARVDATNGIRSYYKIYEMLADLLTTKYGVSSVDSAVLWLRGATEGNANRGAMAALIRTYTDTQYKLRYGISMPDGKMGKEASAQCRDANRRGDSSG
jgi:hypothetical protein